MRLMHASGMRIEDLARLTAVAEHGHVTGSAALLGTSQPTLSRAVARVERDLGARVFQRTPTGVHPTPVGEVVLDAARDIIHRYQALQGTLGQLLDPGSGAVRLAFLDSIATSLVPRVLRRVHEHAPGLRVLLSQEPAHDIVRDLAIGAADLAITSRRPDGAHAWHPLQEERLVLVVPRTHPLAGRDVVDLADIADEALITTPAGYGYRALVEGLLATAGVDPAISFESQDLATIEGLVAAGLGLAVLPETAAGHTGTTGLPLTDPAATRTIGLTWRTDRPLTPPAARFRDLATTTAADREQRIVDAGARQVRGSLRACESGAPVPPGHLEGRSAGSGWRGPRPGRQ